MPDYILRIIRESNDAPAMTTIINVAKHKALTELFLDEGYVVYDCFACQYTKNYGELFLDEADEKNCHSGICLDHHQADSDSRACVKYCCYICKRGRSRNNLCGCIRWSENYKK